MSLEHWWNGLSGTRKRRIIRRMNYSVFALLICSAIVAFYLLLTRTMTTDADIAQNPKPSSRSHQAIAVEHLDDPVIADRSIDRP